MNDPAVHRQDTPKRGRASPRSLSDCHATVFGLHGIGRRVAVQLTALGVQRLQLVDASNVNRRTYATDGYADEDVGRPRVHAAAQACHQVNPKLNIATLPTWSLHDVDLGNAVFCCCTPRRTKQVVRLIRSGHVQFVAAAHVHAQRIYVAATAGPQLAAEALEAEDLLPPWGDATGKRTYPLHIASIVAGLMVAEFARFLRGERVGREHHLDLAKPSLVVTGPA